MRAERGHRRLPHQRVVVPGGQRGEPLDRAGLGRLPLAARPRPPPPPRCRRRRRAGRGSTRSAAAPPPGSAATSSSVRGPDAGVGVGQAAVEVGRLEAVGAQQRTQRGGPDARVVVGQERPGGGRVALVAGDRRSAATADRRRLASARSSEVARDGGCEATGTGGGHAAQLLEAAREVFAERGYQATSVAAITDAASTAHGTFYLYFRNKEDVFAQLMATAMDELYRPHPDRAGPRRRTCTTPTSPATGCRASSRSRWPTGALAGAARGHLGEPGASRRPGWPCGPQFHEAPRRPADDLPVARRVPRPGPVARGPVPGRDARVARVHQRLVRGARPAERLATSWSTPSPTCGPRPSTSAAPAPSRRADAGGRSAP